MGRNKLPHKFGSIPKEIWDRLKGKEKNFLFKYDYFIKQTYKLDDEILELLEDIKEKQKEKEYYRKRSEDIWVTYQHLKEEYSPKLSISKNDKYTKNKERFIGRYWLINVKYKKTNKSIHIGKDDYLKHLLKTNEWIIENKEWLGIEDLNNLTEENIKFCVTKLVSENLYDIIVKSPNFFEEKVKFEDLID